MVQHRYMARSQPESAEDGGVKPLPIDARISTPVVQDVRNVADDIFHALRDRKRWADADLLVHYSDALAYAMKQFEAAGVPCDERERLATEFSEGLIDAFAPRATKSRFRRRKRRASVALAINHPRQLPAP
jgi:hypothetical protein